jgi:hypothetical protein
MVMPISARTAANTTENVICSSRCRVFGVYPELTTTGTITLRNTATAVGATAKHICAIGLLQAGKTFGPHGAVFESGLTVQLSVGTDLSLIVFEPF